MPSPRIGIAGARLLAVALSTVLATSLAPAHAVDEPNPRPVPGDDHLIDDQSDEAVEALENVEQILQGTDSQKTDVTMALIKAKQLAEHLPFTAQLRAHKLLNRPTTAHSDRDLIAYPRGATVKNTCGPNICVHWVTRGEHAPAPKDANDNGVPDWVDTTLRVLQTAWRREVDELGFRAPLLDGNRGGNSKMDAYLGNLSSAGVYGYANTDSYTTKAAPAYLVLDKDYRGYADSSPRPLLRATVAHEFFHMIQFAYTTDEDVWFMEATAAWMEEQVFDGANDNRRYLPNSTLGRPALPLDHDEAKYGNWVFFQHLSEAYGPELVRDMWERAGRQAYSMQAIKRALLAKGTDLKKRFTRFAVDNTMTPRAYAEGKAYPRARVAKRWRFSPQRRATAFRKVKMNHLTSRNFAFFPKPGMGPRWKLRFRVKAPSRLARPVAVVHLKNGQIRRRPIQIPKGNQRFIKVPFSAKKVKRVTLTLTNVSTRYTCNTGALFSCRGVSKDDRVMFRFRAVAVRS